MDEILTPIHDPGTLGGSVPCRVFYDGSKSLHDDDIFNEIAISETYLLGDEESDIMSNEVILEHILKYLDLVIVQEGVDFYIFDRHNLNSDDNTIQFHDLFSETVKNVDISTISISASDYSDDSTQISTDDVYTQVKVKDTLKKYENNIISLMDNDSLQSPYENMQPLCREYRSEIKDDERKKHYDAYQQLLKGEIPDYDDTYFQDWYMRVYKNKNWSIFKDGQDLQLDYMRVDSDGKFINQWKTMEKLKETLCGAAFVGLGKTSKNVKNDNSPTTMGSLNKQLIISVNGNGVGRPKTIEYKNENGNVKEELKPYPSETDLRDADMSIEYNPNVHGTFSPSEDNTTNYLVFSGKMTLNPIQGFSGLAFPSHPYSDNSGSSALRNEITEFGRGIGDYFMSFNTLSNIKNKSRDNKYRYSVIPFELDKDKYMYLNLGFYTNEHALDKNNVMIEDKNFMHPFLDVDANKRFTYDIRGYRNPHNGIDSLYKVPVLACELKIGDKYCVEWVNGEGVSEFEWLTYEEIQNSTYNYTDEDGTVHSGYKYMYTDDDGTQKYRVEVLLGFDMKEGEYVIGVEHDIANNIDVTMNLGSASGMAIPIKTSDALSGELTFKIKGLVNTMWGDLVKRHSTWFRHTSWTSKSYLILPLLSSINISDLNIKFTSDNGGVDSTVVDEGLVYCSNVNNTYVNKKQVDFKIISGVSTSEIIQTGVSSSTYKNTVVDTIDNVPVINITNNVTNEEDKPEKHYVDAKYRDYSEPKLIVESSFKNGNEMTQFNKYSFSYFDKTFLPLGSEYNVAMNTKQITLREI